MTFALQFQKIAAIQSAFCFGIDPSPALLLDWGLKPNISGLQEFCHISTEAAINEIGIVKPQVAFFEAFGPEGLMCLQDLIRTCRNEGLLVIADAKRSDIGSTVTAYGNAWLGEDSPFGANAVTTTAGLGLRALAPVFNRAHETGSGVFVVVRSSNPEGQEVQNALIQDIPLADKIAQDITEINCGTHQDSNVCGPIGAVIGATFSTEAECSAAQRTISCLPASLFLVPGLGAQGGTFEDISNIFGAALSRVIPTSSRSVLKEGPNLDSLRCALRFYKNQTLNMQDTASKIT